MNPCTGSRRSRSWLLGTLFAACGTLAFVLGLRSAADVRPVESSVAQSPGTAQVIVLLQYRPVGGGGSPVPIEVTPFMNGSQTALLQLSRIQDGVVLPSNPADRCLTTNSAGRCTVKNVPVGPDPESLVTTDQQYDVVVDTFFIEFLTGIPLEPASAVVRFDPAACNKTVFDVTDGGAWCLGPRGGPFAPEYFLTITLSERDTCRETAPPASFCDGNGRLVNFACNPATNATLKPWEEDPLVCPKVACPDGNAPQGVCDQVTPGLAACSTAAACERNLLCAVLNVGSGILYDAGTDTIVIRGERFANGGGSVSFPTAGGQEVVRIPAGPNWTDTEIRVRVPLNAVSGALGIHPNSHGSIDGEPVTCASPAVSVSAFADQFTILSIAATTPSGVQLVSPGFDTTFTLRARHNDNVGRFDQIAAELIQGAFPDPDNLPLRRTVITQAGCPAETVGSDKVKETTLTCAVPVPQSASAFEGPFTFIVTLTDDEGGAKTTVLVGSDESALIGDFNIDGILTIEDAVVAFRLASGASPVLPAHRERDTNGDGVIDRADALFVLHSLTQ